MTVVDGSRVLGRVSVRVADRRAAADAARRRPGARRPLVAVRSAVDRRRRSCRSARSHFVRGLPRASASADAAYRGLATAPLSEPQGLSFAALAPQRTIDAAARGSERGSGAALLSSLVLLARRHLPARPLDRRDAAAARGGGQRDRRGQLGERVEVRGRDEFAQLGSAFNDMAAQLEQQRLDELETERAPRPRRDRAFRRGARRDPRPAAAPARDRRVGRRGDRRDRRPRARPRRRARAGGRPGGAGERIAFPLRAGASDFGAARDRRRLVRRRARSRRRRRSPRRRSSRSRTRGCTGSSSGRRSSTASPGSRTAGASRTRCAPSSRAPRGSTTRSASCSPTSTTSSWSTTATATRSATRC